MPRIISSAGFALVIAGLIVAASAYAQEPAAPSSPNDTMMEQQGGAMSLMMEGQADMQKMMKACISMMEKMTMMMDMGPSGEETKTP